jgi:hypothetical protein
MTAMISRLASGGSWISRDWSSATVIRGFLIKSRKSLLDARVSPTQHNATRADYSGKILMFGRFLQ